MPADLTVGQFVYVIRKRIRVTPEQAIFMFVRNVLPPTGALSWVLGVPSRGAGACAWDVCGAPVGAALSKPHAPTHPPRAAALMADVYADHRDEDGFLYIAYSGENTFG